MNLAILQARMSSTRLPGKALKPILGRPMMLRQIERLRRARRIDRLVVATSDASSDDPIAALCAREGVPVHRGSLTDVLSRFCGALSSFGPAATVVRLTADCPVADWRVIDACLDLHESSGADYTSNALERTYPVGLDVEAVKAPLLLVADREAVSAEEREHVTPFFYHRPEQFRIAHLRRAPGAADLRWTVDTQRDFDLISTFYAQLHARNADFSTQDILDLIAARPDLATFNQERKAFS